MSYLEVFGV